MHQMNTIVEMAGQENMCGLKAMVILALVQGLALICTILNQQIFQLIPLEINKDFGEGGDAVVDNSPPSGYNGSTDCFKTSTTFEPPDSIKGDIARIIFYMVVRYEGENGEVDLEMVNYDDSSPSGEPYHGIQSVLYSWHIADAVSSFEQNRNDIIYNYQGNRNPFIDHPEYANYIWGGESPTTNSEPTNHITNLSLGRMITLSWIDPTSGVLPDGYLIKASTVGFFLNC